MPQNSNDKARFAGHIRLGQKDIDQNKLIAIIHDVSPTEPKLSFSFYNIQPPGGKGAHKYGGPSFPHQITDPSYASVGGLSEDEGLKHNIQANESQHIVASIAVPKTQSVQI